MTTEKFAVFIKEERTRLGMTQTELAEKLHVSTAAVSKWERAEDVCADLGLTSEEAEEKYGELARYCHNKDSCPDVVAENHDLRLWAARFGLSEGYIWVYYSQEGFDSDGEVTTGSWRIPSLWYLQPDEEGQWQVVYIKEHA